MTNKELLNEYYDMYFFTRIYEYIDKHNKLLNKLTKRELQSVYSRRFGRLNFETSLALDYTKKNYIRMLKL